MAYDRLGRHLDGGLASRRVVTLPDGSVDRYYAVETSAGDRIPSKRRFVDRIADANARSLQLRPEATRAGGQAVNAATQVDALDAPVTLYGHLDAPELRHLPFPAESMGDPATVHVLTFDEEDLMLSVESGDIREWSLDDLFAVLDVDPDEWLTDEVVVVQNWVGFPGMTDALRALAAVDLGAATVVFDPGDITGAPADSIEPLCGALGVLGEAVDVVVTANDGELARIADVLSLDADGRQRERRLRERLGVHAVVRHAEPRAVAADGDLTVVENFDARAVARRTGAGDRFTGGLATALAGDLPMAAALALGNACATHYVERGETATRRDVSRLLDSRSVE